MTQDEALAREEIRKTMMRYNIGGDRGRLHDLASAFAADGVLDTETEGETPAKGPAAIVAMLERLGKRYAHMTLCRHNLTTSRIDFTSPDTAEGRTYFFVLTEIGPDHAGVYTDRFRKVGEEWLIEHRRVRLDWAAPNSIMMPGWTGRPRKRA